MQPAGRVAIRSTRLIFTAAALGSTSLFAAFTVAPLVASDLTGSDTWSGLPGAMSVAGTAAGAALLSAVMARRGRSAGLQLGYAIGVAGAAVAVIGARAGSLAGLIAGMSLLGVGNAANQLGRYAAADLHPEERRPRVLGWIVWASTIGAVAGPTLPRALGAPSRALGLSDDGAGLLVALVFLACAVVVALALRDAGAASEAPAPDGDPAADPVTGAVALRPMLRLTHVRRALIVMLTAQVAMVLVMTVTPVEVRAHGHGLGVVGLVMSAHFVGMFALAPLAGRLVAAAGVTATMAAGATTLVLAAAGAAISTGAREVPIGGWLFLLGLGWSMTFVAGSAELTRGLSYRERVRLQGGVDAMVWTAGGLASASSGLVLDRAGYAALATAGAAIGLVCLAAALAGRRARVVST